MRQPTWGVVTFTVVMVPVTVLSLSPSALQLLWAVCGRLQVTASGRLMAACRSSPTGRSVNHDYCPGGTSHLSACFCLAWDRGSDPGRSGQAVWAAAFGSGPGPPRAAAQAGVPSQTRWRLPVLHRPAWPGGDTSNLSTSSESLPSTISICLTWSTLKLAPGQLDLELEL